VELTPDPSIREIVKAIWELHERLETVEKAVISMQMRLKTVHTAKGAKTTVTRLEDLSYPVNDCKKCDGLGHLSTPEGVVKCECSDDFHERVKIYQDLKKKLEPKIKAKPKFRQI
jgi:hypothetical protein